MKLESFDEKSVRISVGVTTIYTTWPYLFPFSYKSHCLFCRETKAEGEANVRPSEVQGVAQPAVSQHGSIAETGKDAGVEVIGVGLMQENQKN